MKRLLVTLAACGVALGSAVGPTAAQSPSGDDPLAPFLPPQNPPVVRGVDIEGLQRIDRGTVRSRIYTQIGQPLDTSRVSEDIKRIYGLNFFDDIQVAQVPHPDGGVDLVFRVSERPTVVSVELDIQGDSVSREDVEKVVDLRRFEIVDEAKIRFNLTKIEELYVEEGHFLVDTSYRLEERPDNGVAVVLQVREGREVTVRRVDIVGNRNVPADEIKGILFTREGGLFSFLDQSGQFKREMFEQDVQRIQLYYLTKGFVEISVDDPVVTISPDKRSLAIVIRVTEGPRYRTGDVAVEMEGDEWLIPKDELEEELTLEPGEWFDYQQLEADRAALSNAYKDRGYANAVVSTDHHRDGDALTFGVTFKIQKGEPVYIRRIEITGNRDTRDKVIRREMRIHEGDLYNGDGIRRSRARIGSLGFFDNVDITPRPTSRDDQMDLVVRVRERQTGQFQVGAGFSSLESFILTAQISKQNFLGRGQTVSAQLTLSAIRQLYSISFFEPYFLDTSWTFAFDLFNFQEEFIDFTRLRTGGNITLGYRLTDDLSVSLTYTLADINATLRSTDIQIRKLKQEGLTSSVRGTVALDTRDDRQFPSSGQYTTLSLEHASELYGSENEFVRIIGRTRWYFPMFWDFVLRLNGTVGWVSSPEGEAVPLFERFFVGGIFTVRGFERNSIGEQLYLTSIPDGGLNDITIGGNKQLILNAEIEFPIFKEVQIKGVVFLDAGNAWGDAEALNPFDLRTAAGFGIRWHSPVGPLRFEWGFPLAPRPGEDPMVFEFTIGNSF